MIKSTCQCGKSRSPEFLIPSVRLLTIAGRCLPRMKGTRYLLSSIPMDYELRLPRHYLITTPLLSHFIDTLLLSLPLRLRYFFLLAKRLFVSQYAVISYTRSSARANSCCKHKAGILWFRKVTTRGRCQVWSCREGFSIQVGPKAEEKVVKGFLMLVNDIPQLVRMLRFTMLSVPGSQYEFCFGFEHTLVDPSNSAGRSFLPLLA